jgi:hypothetical protein
LEEIPSGFYLNDSFRKTIDKCIIKCNSCNLESIQKGLCLKCNNIESYYQKYNDSSNFDSYVNCYNEKPFGFYLDNTDVDNIIYKPCYDTCNQSYYYYKINSILRELTNKFINSTFIYFSPEQINHIYNKYNLNEEIDSIYTLIFNDENSSISSNNYNYKLVLEDGRELNLSIIEEDIYYNVYTPIKNVNLTNYNYYLYFLQQGYDIYDKYNSFYNDICAPAYLEGNDITLEDRKIDFYPTNLTLCKDNCNYNGIDLENKKIICVCNMNNKNYINGENNLIEYTKDNFFSYLLDNINYKIFKCYQLFVFENLKNNLAFYTFIVVLVIFLVIALIFFLYSVPKLKILLVKDIFKNEIKIKTNGKNKKIKLKKL